MLIDKVILQNCRRTYKELVTGWIDYKTAYDMVPQLWLKEAVELAQLADNLKKLLFDSMERWKTILTANNKVPGSQQQGRYLPRRYSFPSNFCHSADRIIYDIWRNEMWILTGKVDEWRIETNWNCRMVSWHKMIKSDIGNWKKSWKRNILEEWQNWSNQSYNQNIWFTESTHGQ